MAIPDPDLVTAERIAKRGAAMTIRCIKFRRFEKNTLKGFADFELTRVGLILRDCTLHEKDGRQWIGFPAKSFTGQDGATKWTPLIEFADGAVEARKQFQQQALDAIRAMAGEGVSS